MASLIMEALSIQTAAAVLLMPTSTSPIRAAQTTVVEDELTLFPLRSSPFKNRSRNSSRGLPSGAQGPEEKDRQQSQCDETRRAQSANGMIVGTVTFSRFKPKAPCRA